MAKNLQLPGNPRYQPKQLQEIFGYDNLYNAHIDVELAVLETLGDIGIVPAEEVKLLTEEVKQNVRDNITASDVDKLEKEVTKHDIRALVNLIKEQLPEELRRWVHVPLTSNDVINSAQVLQFLRAHRVLQKDIKKLVGVLAKIVSEQAGTVQVGRTHGQHALPITAGFWLATILNRVLYNARSMDYFASNLVGKISGAVGAYNAQYALGITKNGEQSFEERVLEKLGVNVAPISTQLAPPEPLAQYLLSAGLLSASLAQFGRDCRHLMRSEIAELAEEFAKGQVGSSTMAHKRNPISFENLEGMWLKNKNEFGKVLDTLISEHQRDLVGSSVVRDYPTVLVNLSQQINTLLREKPSTSSGQETKTFLERIKFDEESMKQNLEKSANAMMAELLYLSLQIAGYTGDAHELVNHGAMPIMNEKGGSLIDAMRELAEKDEQVAEALSNIPEATMQILENPATYTGKAKEKALQIASDAENYLNG